MAQHDLEQRMHALICGRLEGGERAELLAMIASDAGARQVLDEMLTLQRLAREACGHDEAARRVMETSLKQLQTRLQAPAAPPRWRIWKARRVARSLSWALRAAAVFIVAASVYVAWDSHQRLTRQLSRLEQAVQMPRLGSEELAMFRNVWQQVRQGDDQAPWVLLDEGGGRFGYLPQRPGLKSTLALVRCHIIDSQTQTVRKIQLVMPLTSESRLALSEAGEFNGKTISLDVVGAGDSTVVGLRVGGAGEGATGVSGRVTLDSGPVEVGQFRLNGQTLHVVVQALALGTGQPGPA